MGVLSGADVGLLCDEDVSRSMPGQLIGTYNLKLHPHYRNSLDRFSIAHQIIPWCHGGMVLG